MLSLQEPEFQKASLVFKWLMEGKDVNIPGTSFTYKQAKLLVARMEKSEYFKQMQMEVVAAIKKEKEEPTTAINTQVKAVMSDLYKYLADLWGKLEIDLASRKYLMTFNLCY